MSHEASERQLHLGYALACRHIDGKLERGEEFTGTELEFVQLDFVVRDWTNNGMKELGLPSLGDNRQRWAGVT